jgi:PKD repeat protein
MEKTRAALTWLNVSMSVLLLAACQESSQSPPARSEQPPEEDGRSESRLRPIDLIYVCGNKFLATNSTGSTAEVDYRVLGSGEGGRLVLSDGSDEHSGYSETELQVRGTGPVELYQDGERVARRRNEGKACGPAPFSGSLAGLTEAEAGKWDAPIPWTGVATHLNLLSTGKVLSWGEFVAPQVWNPVDGSFSSVPSPVLLFCSGHSFLADGRLLVVGGHIGTARGLADITIFDPITESWSRSVRMPRGRWYPTVTTLASGDGLILFGTDENAVRVDQPEVWSNGALRSLPATTIGSAYYPRTFLAPNGKVFHAGDVVRSRYLDPLNGTWTSVGDRVYGKRDYGAAVMYDVGKILYVGGGRSTNTAEIINLNSSAPSWQFTGSMATARRHLNATVLPSGEVLVTGGVGGTDFNDLTRPARAAELWDPGTGKWTVLASSAVTRGYHSTSILLPDGRVLHAGSGDKQGAPAELNAELFSPPYLFKGPRPTISAAPSLVGYGTSFRVVTPDANVIAKISLIRIGSATHAFDMNQRLQWLSFSRQSGALSITAPTSRNVTPPGHYMLFLLDENGVPSVAKIVQVGSESSPDPDVNTPPSSLFQAGCTGLTCEFTDGSTDGDGSVVAWRWEFGDGEGSTTRNPQHTYTAEGDYEVRLNVTDNDGATGMAVKTISVKHPPSPGAPVADFTWVCTGLNCTFTDGSTDEGTVEQWTWDFGDQGSSSVRNPTHAFVAAGSYEVSLTATDNDEMTGTKVRTVTVTAPSPIVLAVTGRVDATKQYMMLTWTGAQGATVDVYRDGVFTKNELNDGKYTNSRNLPGASQYTYKVCQAGTAVCSNNATVVFGEAPPTQASIVLSVTGRVDATKQYMTLTWTGAQGATVDVYRDGVFTKNELNDGKYTNSRNLPGASQYTYKVCQAGTAVCSNNATVVFN